MFISTESLLSVYMKLRASEDLKKQLKVALSETYDSLSYKNWLTNDEPSFALPPITDGKFSEILTNLGLASKSHLLLKINKLRSQIFLTDGLWTPSAFRVFPFSDESCDLLDYLDTHSGITADWCVDLATGCGHVALPLSQLKKTIACDVNPRALMFAQINALLNDINPKRLNLLLNDLRNGVIVPDFGSGLVIGNLPFGVSVAPNSLPLTSAGGQYGLDFQLETLKHLREVKIQPNNNIRILLLGLSFGNTQQNDWQIVQEARAILGARCLSIEWNILKDVKIPRTNGLRELPNPTTAANLFDRTSSCSVYAKGQNSSELRNLLRGIERNLSRMNFQDVSYGILDIVI